MPSTAVTGFNYDEPHSTLKVIYTSGSAYAYLNVPRRVYLAMKRAFSKGGFLNRNIKGKYPFKKLN